MENHRPAALVEEASSMRMSESVARAIVGAILFLVSWCLAALLLAVAVHALLDFEWRSLSPTAAPKRAGLVFGGSGLLAAVPTILFLQGTRRRSRSIVGTPLSGASSSEVWPH
jgi:hypothetical protein